MEAIEKTLADAGIISLSIIVQPDVRTTDSSDKQNLPFAVLDLWDSGVMSQPPRWGKATMPERLRMAADAMAIDLRKKDKCSQILFILSGQKEIEDARLSYRVGFQFRLETTHLN